MQISKKKTPSIHFLNSIKATLNYMHCVIYLFNFVNGGQLEKYMRHYNIYI